MRKAWIVLSVMAVANLIALSAFVGWLRVSDRLDVGRISDVRRMFSETLTQRRTREEEAAAQAAALAQVAAEKARQERPPISAADALALRLEMGKADQERVES